MGGRCKECGDTGLVEADEHLAPCRCDIGVRLGALIPDEFDPWLTCSCPGVSGCADCEKLAVDPQ